LCDNVDAYVLPDEASDWSAGGASSKLCGYLAWLYELRDTQDRGITHIHSIFKSPRRRHGAQQVKHLQYTVILSEEQAGTNADTTHI